MALSFLLFQKGTCCVTDKSCADCAPGNIFRIFLVENLDFFPVDEDPAVALAEVAGLGAARLGLEPVQEEDAGHGAAVTQDGPPADGPTAVAGRMRFSLRMFWTLDPTLTRADVAAFAEDGLYFDPDPIFTPAPTPPEAAAPCPGSAGGCSRGAPTCGRR